MKFLLDTNVCIKILKGQSDKVLSRIAEIKNSDVCIPAIVRYELYYGAFKSENKEKTLNLLDNFLSQFFSETFDDKMALICGEIRALLDKKGTPVGPYDIMIAAIAMSKNLILVTHNTNEFSRIEGLVLEDWEL